MLLATKANVNSKISVKQTSSAIEAQTEYLTLSTGVKCALVECKIYTGRFISTEIFIGF